MWEFDWYPYLLQYLIWLWNQINVIIAFFKLFFKKKIYVKQSIGRFNLFNNINIVKTCTCSKWKVFKYISKYYQLQIMSIIVIQNLISLFNWWEQCSMCTKSRYSINANFLEIIYWRSIIAIIYTHYNEFFKKCIKFFIPICKLIEIINITQVQSKTSKSITVVNFLKNL